MIRLCIIGNSHAAALKLATDAFRADHPEARLSFFAAPSRETSALEVTDGRYAASTPELAAQLRLTSGGHDGIAPSEYDAFLVYGFGGRGDFSDNPRLLSAAFCRAVALERVRRSLLPRHIAALRQLTHAPIFAALTPLPGIDGIRKPRRLMRYKAEMAMVQAQICDPHGVTLCPQPPESLVKGRATRAEFAAGSQPLENAHRPTPGAHDRSERRHMNAAYGRLWLEHFWPRLRATLAEGPKRAAE